MYVRYLSGCNASKCQEVTQEYTWSGWDYGRRYLLIIIVENMYVREFLGGAYYTSAVQLVGLAPLTSVAVTG